MNKILVHLHIYYKEQTNMFARKINSSLNGYDYDLFITINGHDEEIKREFLSFKPDTKFVIVENIGADILPFITVLNLVNLDDYDYLVKLHTKKIYDKKIKIKRKTNSFPAYNIHYWNKYLTSFLRKQNIKKIIRNFEDDEKLGMVADYRIISKKFPPFEKIYLDTKKLFESQGICCENLIHPSGTMFFARASIFNLVKQLNLNASYFQKFYSCDETLISTFPYTMEIFIGNCANANGLLTKDVYTPKLKLFVPKFVWLIQQIPSFIFSINRMGDERIKVVKVFNITVKKLGKGK